MSDETTKVKRSTRKHNTWTNILKQKKITKFYGIQHTKSEIHRYAKKKALNCGNPGCVLCGNPRKTFKQKTIQELSFEQTEKWSEE